MSRASTIEDRRWRAYRSGPVRSRVDHTFNTRDSLYGSYIYNIQADDTVPTFTWDSRGNRARAQNASLTELHIFSPSVVNEVRAGWHRFFEHEFFGTTDRENFDIANIIGLPASPSFPATLALRRLVPVTLCLQSARSAPATASISYGRFLTIYRFVPELTR